MLKQLMSPKPSELDKTIARALAELDRHAVGSEEYVKTLDILSKLMKLKADERPKQISKDTILVSVTNLLGIMLIIRYEQFNIVTTKAMNLAMKPKTP
jgi:hypothetical protein